MSAAAAAISRRTVGRAVAALAVALTAPAFALDARKLRKRYLKAASDLEQLAKAPPEGLAAKDAPAFEELQKLLRGAADMLRTAAAKLTDDDEALASSVQEQLAAAQSRLDKLRDRLSAILKKMADTAAAIIGNLK